MKKLVFVFVVSFVLCCSVLVGCGTKNVESQVTVDYSKYSFTDISWTRQAEHDIETIRFGSDGSFRYSCSCGNPVNDADLCEGYTYDDKTKTITLNCIEITDDMVTTIVIENFDQNSIQLNFNGEIRTFTKN